MNPESPSPLPPLPIEVWGKIFENIDNPLDLMRFRTVCKMWNEEINRVLPFANWKKLCFREIGEFSLSSIAAVIHPTLPKANYREIEDQDFWKHVYYHYKKWIRIKELPIRTLTAPVKSSNDQNSSVGEYITCFDILGNWNIYGTNLGKIHILQSDGHEINWYDIYSQDVIDEVKIWHGDNDRSLLVAVTKSGHMLIAFLDDLRELAGHENSHIDNTPKGHKICIGTANNLYYILNDFLVQLKVTQPNVDLTIVRLNFNADEQVVALSSRESKIFLVVRAEAQMRIFTIEDKSLTGQQPTFQVLSIVEVPSLPVVFSDMHVSVTLNSTIICLINGKMYLHTPGTYSWVIHDQSKCFGAWVTSFIVHGNYLIIGLSNGTLSMYYVEGTDNLLSPNLFEQQPVIMRQLDTLPIIAIKVMDDHGKIYITTCSGMQICSLVF